MGWPKQAQSNNSLVYDPAGPYRERHHRRQSVLFTRCPNSRLQKRMTTFGAWPKTNEKGWKKVSAYRCHVVHIGMSKNVLLIKSTFAS